MSSTASDSLEFCSMDYWDYFVELECLQNSKGKDLQLAAELGKTLLERNKELETGLKQQQSVIDDQSQEIEYLSKQSVALREVNDSRLRVYEQLEVSIQELEVTNQRLQADSSHDKKQIRSLGQTVECLEARGAELQALVDELRADERTRRSAACAEQQCGSSDRRDSQHRSRADELTERVAVLELQLAEWRERERLERERRLRSEAESVAALEESAELHREMAALRERSIKLHTLAEEVHEMEEHRLTPFLQRCSPRDCSTSPQMAGQPSQVAAPSSAGCSPTPPPTRSVWGDQTAVRWPTSEASPTPPAGHKLVSPRPEATRSDCGQLSSAPTSLINDLDAHYRVLLDEMDKYEWLLCSRQPRATSADQPSSLSLLQELQQSSCVDGSAGEAGAVRRLVGMAPPRDSGPDSLMLLAAASDGEASSSGFSEGSSESRTVSRATQTPEVPAPPHGAPLARQLTIGRFQHTPQYKQLFQEIFEVLKKQAVVERPARVVESTSEPEPVFESVGPSEAVRVAAQPAPADGALAPAANPWTFSYTQEFEKCLKASESSHMHTLCMRGAAKAAPDAVSLECEAEEFPHLSRPSEEVAKLRLLERSYAEALKAGRRCLNRASRCQMSDLTSE